MKGTVAAALAAVCIVSAAEELSAQTKAPVHFIAPAQMAGTGCPSGSFRASGEGSSALTVALSKYDAASPASAAASGMERAACSFALPLRVPQGWQISSLTMTWKGRAKGKTELRREYFLAGERGTVKTSQPSGPFKEQDKLPSSLFSSCGEDLVLRINSSVRATAPGSQITVGGQSGKLSLRLKWQKCRS